MSEGSGNERCYVDNAMNRRLGRAGMPLGSMVVSSRGSSASSSGASFFGSSLSDGGRTYVDNYMNRRLGRVGMPLGSMVVSNRGNSASSYDVSNNFLSLSDSSRGYVDNYMNRGLGRVGMPLGSMVVSNRGHRASLYDNSDICPPLSDCERAYVDNYMNRGLGRVGMPLGSMVVSSKESSAPFQSYNNYISNSSEIAIIKNIMQQILKSFEDESKPTSISCRELPSPPKTDNEYNQGLEWLNRSAACSMTESSRERSTSPSSVYIRERSPVLDSERSYVDNSINRSLDRVGMPLGSMPVSNLNSKSSSSTKSYVDNEYNQRLGREGLGHGSMVVSKDSGIAGYTRTKHDVGELTNKSFEQVDLPGGANIKDENVYEEKPWHRKSRHYCKGSSPPSSVSIRKSSASAPNDTFFGSNNSSSRKKYVDNALNRNLGRVDMPVGSKPVSKSKSRSSSSSKTYVDNESKQRLGRVGMEHGSMVVSKDSGSGNSSGTKHYVDNSTNRSLGQVGLPDGECGKKVPVYKDTPLNRELGRVGLPIGTAVVPKSRNLESYCIMTELLHKADIKYRENLDEDIDYNNLPALSDEFKEDPIRVGMEHGSLVVSNDSGIASSKGMKQCVGNSKSKFSSKTYVDNKYNRQRGRVGLDHGSMVVSKDSGIARSKETKQKIDNSKSRSSSSSKTYVDNEYNRRLGRVGLEHGSMVVSKDSGIASSKETKQKIDNSKSRSSSSSKTYVDNEYNNRLGRVGLEHGSMVVSKDSATASSKETKQNIDNSKSRSSSSSKIYVDNECNRRLGRVGLEHGSKDSETASSKEIKHYVDNSTNRSLGRVGLPYGADSEEVRVYKDNLLNRKLGRVGLPLGTKVKSKSGSLELKFYADNPENRRLGRVGFPVGSRPKGYFPGPKRTYCNNYLNRTLGRVGMELGTAPVTSCKKIKWFQKAYQRLRKNPDEDIDFDSFPILLSEEEEDTFEKLVHVINRLQLEREWQEKANLVPKTSDYLLHYSGPVIEDSEINLGNIIGSGGFGEVYYGTYKDSVVAVKKLHVKQVNEHLQKNFFDEVNILSKLDNPFIVKFIGACIKPPNLCIVMEYMQMSLEEALHVGCTDMNDFTDSDRLKMIIQTLSGLEYLHNKNVAHCDIKPGNILIDHDGEKFTVAKLSDFGLSMMEKETKSSSSSDSDFVCNIGTPIYSSPELLRGEYLNLDQMKMSDMYSYGLVVFEILCGVRPFRNLRGKQLENQVAWKNLYPKFPDGIHLNVQLKEILQKCWERKPENRPTATDFLEVMKRIPKVYSTLD